MFTLPSITVEKPTPISGPFAFVDDGVAGEPWHERLVLGHVTGSSYIIVTADNGVYEEELSFPWVPVLSFYTYDNHVYR